MDLIDVPYRRFLREAERLCSIFEESISHRKPPIPSARQLAAEMAVVRLHDAWYRFCRELVIVSASEKPTTVVGRRLGRAPGITSRADVIPTLLSTYNNPRLFEPNWALGHVCIECAQRLAVNNLSEISASIGSSNSPADDLRVVRNYYCHRGRDTAEKVKRMSWFSSNMQIEPWSIPGMKVSGGITLYRDWVNRLQAVSFAAIQ